MKKEAAHVLEDMGLSVSDAIRIMLVRVAAEKALPFEVKVPNAAPTGAYGAIISVITTEAREMPVHKIGRADVAARLADIANKNGLFAANRARAALSALYGWAIGEGLVDQNPVVGTRKATEEISRDRTLSEEELRSIWQLAGDGEYGAIIRLLILTG